ncbi:MAG: DUF4391 domain-containing protein [Phycisphaerae bacterium]
MTIPDVQRLIGALRLPDAASVQQRVPKSLLIEHGASTASDKRLIEAGVDELRWIASLKPATVGIAAFEDSARQCVELIVLTLSMRPDSKPTRLLELVHRAIPYHTLLLASEPNGKCIGSLADKRWSQVESGRVVLDGEVVSTDLTTTDRPTFDALLGTLAVSRRPYTNLYSLYRTWLDAMLAVEASRKTGAFVESDSTERFAARHAALAECAELEKRINAIRVAAAKERQMSRQVELNLQARQLQIRYEEARKLL